MEEGIRQLALISSVLGGFSFTFLSALITLAKKSQAKFFTIVILMIASMCFLLCALGWSMIDFDSNKVDLMNHHQFLVKLILIGLLSLIGSLGLSGWISDRKTGIATSVIAFISMLILYFSILTRYINF